MAGETIGVKKRETYYQKLMFSTCVWSIKTSPLQHAYQFLALNWTKGRHFSRTSSLSGSKVDAGNHWKNMPIRKPTDI